MTTVESLAAEVKELREIVEELLKAQPKKKFTPPTQSEVSAQMISKGLNEFVAQTESGKFVDHYETNGWVRGKTKMANWRSAVNIWLTNLSNNGTSTYSKSLNPSNGKIAASEARLNDLALWGR